MSLHAIPGGDDDNRGTHLSVSLCLWKGPHDDKLTWPLREEFEVKLLYQISDSEHYSKRIHYEDEEYDAAARLINETDNAFSIGQGDPQFIASEDLQEITPTCQYLKDDCLFLQVSKV